MKSSPRRRARELVLQGLYQRQLSGNDPESIRVQLIESHGYDRADQRYFGELWSGTLSGYDGLLGDLAPLLDRRPTELSPIERAILVIGAWELVHRVEIPCKVVINEAVDLAKSYGGTDGHKYVNGVLDKFAGRARGEETAALARERKDRATS
jgi:transcription antitermination protein NusB